MNNMKILHLASFTGNIGDEANHSGFRRKLRENLDMNFTYTDLEIRKFYKSWGLMKFDNSFVHLCNSHDFVIIGGGNFLELCWDYSQTGTTIDISIEMLEKIKRPIIFNTIGVDDGKGISQDNIDKFKVFLDYILDSDKILFSVRNDGSKDILKKYFNDSKLDSVHVVPDGGFFLTTKDFYQVEYDKNKVNIGINIAGDMISIRFGDNYNGFCKNFGNYINTILSINDNINIVFLPHMYLDIRIIGETMEYIEDEYRRNRISIAPLLNGNLNGGQYIFNLYRNMDLILGMRFHSNVCSIGQNIPNIGLITYHKHGYLFDEVGLSDRALFVNDSNFFIDLLSKTKDDLNNLEKIKDRYKVVNKKLNNDLDEFHQTIKRFLEGNEKLLAGDLL
ncbi:polysaccharide pyruvyl transferase family protein [Wansuia hejianensis]|uniref:Polysaccharide pyruvyl transferase family protein n=1 Tax=Wansuia hejianensis TaxID=2763667 RepID=A0A926EZ62_9FIRM|nr:polysaccharide pyruvyl transferase family protein [Wansuia hejianensis]MBC8590316.1 polysaccharide pyruvyl transferase family protein [Wansuia hejianensis]